MIMGSIQCLLSSLVWGGVAVHAVVLRLVGFGSEKLSGRVSPRGGQEAEGSCFTTGDTCAAEYG